MVNPRFLLVTLPAQGQINPALQFAERLIRIGAEVTYTTTIFAHRRMLQTTIPNGLTFAPFSDGNDDGFNPATHDFIQNNLDIERLGSQAVGELIKSAAEQGQPFSCLVYPLLVPWAGKVARKFHLRTALLWVQPATVFDINYHYFYGYGDIIKKNGKDPSFSLKFPGLPVPISICDLPSIMKDAPNRMEINFKQSLVEMFEGLELESNPIILSNTFDALEPEAFKAISNFNLIGIGPLIPFSFFDEKSPSEISFCGDPVQSSEANYVRWLNSKPKASVVYVSFGSLSVLSKPQTEEIEKGLLHFGRPFLWVIREKEDEKLSCREELEKLGMIVPWCSQLDVLSNSSLACFVTHCGWNSSLESLVSGVPVVAFPQWFDQITNAKLIEDLWKTGVRVKRKKDGIVEGGEIKRCLELLMGDEEKGKEIRSNAEKWKSLAGEAAREGGSSERNFEAFMNEVLGKVSLCLD
ncbi:hypothetical protein UlMin_010641 [Ulmus minor]